MTCRLYLAEHSDARPSRSGASVAIIMACPTRSRHRGRCMTSRFRSLPAHPTWKETILTPLSKLDAAQAGRKATVTPEDVGRGTGGHAPTMRPRTTTDPRALPQGNRRCRLGPQRQIGAFRACAQQSAREGRALTSGQQPDQLWPERGGRYRSDGARETRSSAEHQGGQRTKRRRSQIGTPSTRAPAPTSTGEDTPATTAFSTNAWDGLGLSHAVRRR
ncbi:hypothetical protein BC628DRAFT_1073768 [Trametes gibbosa]|nr:hypothetical protein BC628DRAFT_1073768 [Trametes gibbosa]